MSNYTSKAVVASLTGKTESDIEQSWLDWADALIEEKTGMTFFPAVEETLTIDGNGLDIIELSKKPIIEVTKIVITSAGIDVYTYEGDDISTYFALYKDDGFIAWRDVDDIALPNEFSEGVQNIEITGKFGYASIPKNIEELATLLVIRQMLIRYPDLQVDSEKIGDYSISYKRNGSNLDSSINELWDLILDEEYDDLYFSGE